MFHPIILAALASAPADSTPTAVREAALFKNGYAFITREFDLHSSGKTRITSIPQVTYGSFWLTATQGVTITSAVNKMEAVDAVSIPGNLVEFLSMNVGKVIEIESRNPGAEAIKTLTGTLKSVNGQMVILQSGGEANVLFVNDIIRVKVKDGAVLERKFQSSRRVIEVNSRGKGTGTLYGIEAGMSWTPHYYIDVSDPKKMKLVARCTVVNDLAKLENATLRFVTGSPSIRYQEMPDPFTYIAQRMVGGPGGGGFGGSGSMQNVASDAPAAARMEAMDGAFEKGGEGEAIGDLYFYTLKGINLDQGERGYFVLFSQEHPYDYLYTVDFWDGQREGVATAVRTLRFTNNGDKPLTSASALMVSNGAMVGQDELKYTAIGQESLVAVSNALDVRSEILEEEVSRERQALRRNDGATWDLVTLRGTIEITNLKNEAVPLRLRKRMTGEVFENSAGKASRSSTGLNQINSNSMIEWTPTLKAGEKVKLTYKYRVYVN